MPIGSFTTIPVIAFELSERKPKSVLDLGIGFGMWGAAVREWVDMGVSPYKTLLHGVEGFHEYYSPLWKLYNRIHNGLIQDFEPKQKYDFIIFADVLEHFSQEQGAEVLEKIKTWLTPGGVLMVATPGLFVAQDDVYGNELERHLSLWLPRDLQAHGFEILRDETPDKYGHMMVIGRYVNPVF